MNMWHFSEKPNNQRAGPLAQEVQTTIIIVRNRFIQDAVRAFRAFLTNKNESSPKDADGERAVSSGKRETKRGKRNEEIRPMAGVLQARMEQELAFPGRLCNHRNNHHQVLSWPH